MTGRKQHRSKIGDKEGEASSKTDDTAPFAEGLPEDLEKLRSALLSDMTQVVHSLLTTELAGALSPVNATLEQVKSYYEAHDERLREVEDGLNDYSDRLVNVETAMDALRRENVSLKEKLDDLENRSRRSNVRVVGIPEKMEGSDPIKFITDFFEEVLGKDFFTSPLVISRAHRVGPNSSNVKETSAKQTRSRVFLVLFHYFQDKHRIIQFSRQRRELFFRGHRVFFHEDFSADLAKKRAAFKEVKSRLFGKGVRFGLLYPARLRVTHEGKTYLFDTPNDANEFYRSHWEDE